MAQSTPRGYLFFPKGAYVGIKADGDGSFTNVGCLANDIEVAHNYDINQVQTNNCGKTDPQATNQSLAGSMTLIDLDPIGIEKFGGGLLSLTTQTATPTTGVDDYTVAVGWTNMGSNNLVFIESGVTLRVDPATAPTITSVTASTAGVLAVDDDYFIVADTDSPSGYSILFNTAGTAGVTTAESVVVDYNSVTPRAGQTITAGSDSVVMSTYALQISQSVNGGKTRSLDIYSAYTNSGAFAFNFKSAFSEGTEEMPLAFTADLDTDRTDMDQLYSYYTEDGAGS